MESEKQKIKRLTRSATELFKLIGKKGGKVKSPAKAEAVRLNLAKANAAKASRKKERENA